MRVREAGNVTALRMRRAAVSGLHASHDLVGHTHEGEYIRRSHQAEATADRHHHCCFPPADQRALVSHSLRSKPRVCVSDVCRDRSALTRTVESSSLFRELRLGLDTIRIAIPRLQAAFRTIVVGGFPSKVAGGPRIISSAQDFAKGSPDCPYRRRAW